jgi:hypothetical protein
MSNWEPEIDLRTPLSKNEDIIGEGNNKKFENK